MSEYPGDENYSYERSRRERELFKAQTEGTFEPPSARHEEWHVTVAGDPFQWRGFCAANDIKPLWIELNNFERQLMCAASFNPCERIMQAKYTILRVKHEVSALRDDERALYFEAHLKLDGPFRPEIHMASRDLFRTSRWYVTKRAHDVFNAAEWMQNMLGSITSEVVNVNQRSVFAGCEYEACLLDSNPELDSGWTRSSRFLNRAMGARILHA